MLESLASAELDDESGSSGDESDEEAGQSRSKLQERYKWLLQQRAGLQQQLEKLQNGRQTEQKETTWTQLLFRSALSTNEAHEMTVQFEEKYAVVVCWWLWSILETVIFDSLIASICNSISSELKIEGCQPRTLPGLWAAALHHAMMGLW